MRKAIHAQENKDAARIKAQAVVKQLWEMKFTAAAKKIETGIDETLTNIGIRSEQPTSLNG